MVSHGSLIGFVATENPARAKSFYRDALGLRLVSEDQFAIAFDANGVMLRVTIVPKLVVAPYTVLGWQVDDIHSTVATLANNGVRFERFAGMDQDEHGIWTSPAKAKICWFKDPDGNLLSLTQFNPPA